MFTDPLSVTYSGSARSMPRIGTTAKSATYKAANGEFEVIISELPPQAAGREFRSVQLSRTLPDMTPADVFDAMREVKNTFGYFYMFDPTRAGLSTDLSALRTALDSWVTSGLQDRIVAGEK